MKKIATMLCALAGALCLGGQALAQTVDYSDMPTVKMYYPGNNPDSPMNLDASTKAYIYFNTPSNVTACKANVLQGGEVVGTFVYDPMTNHNTCMLDPNNATNKATNQQVQVGNFSVEFYYLTYIVGDEEKTYDNASEPYGTVVYNRPVGNGSIVAESGLNGLMIKSYYPLGGNEGVKTYTFNKPISPAALNSYFVYGLGEFPNMTTIPHSLSEDGLTLTIDLRGMCNNVETLAPGVAFVDDSGAPTDPPASISLVIEGLNCLDGTKITTQSVSLDGQHTINLNGQIYQAHHYTDISLPNPVITKVEFYNSANPNKCYADMSETTDRMAIRLANESSIAIADILLTNGSASATVADGNYQKAEGAYLVEIPEQIKSVGSAGLCVSLINVEYVAEDGVDHQIAPYEFAGGAVEMLSIAQLKSLEDGTETILNVPGGLKVTLANEYGYIFVEDNAKGIQILTSDNSCPFTEGTMITGAIKGTFWAPNVFSIDIESLDVTSSPTDVSQGIEVEDLGYLATDFYNERLITIVMGEEAQAEVNAAGEISLRGMAVYTGFITGYKVPEGAITKLTGVFTHINTAPVLLMRNADDIVSVPAGITGIEAPAAIEGSCYNLQGIRVTPNRPGLYLTPSGKKLVK